MAFVYSRMVSLCWSEVAHLWDERREAPICSEVVDLWSERLWNERREAPIC